MPQQAILNRLNAVVTEAMHFRAAAQAALKAAKRKIEAMILGEPSS